MDISNGVKNEKQNASPQEEVIFSWKDLKKSEQKKEPSRIKTTLRKSKLILDFKIKKTETFLKDHWHLLIKSAAQNHLRIQQCKKIEAGQVCNLEFGSFSELKRYQKKVRLFTYSFSSTAFSILIAIFVVQMFFGAGKSQGANYYWVQSAWSGVANARVATSAIADHSDRTGWTEFSFKDGTVDVAGSDVKIVASLGSKIDTNATDFDDTNTTKTNVYTVGTGDTALALRKKDGASCTASGECRSGLMCIANVCTTPWQNGPASAVGLYGGYTYTISASTCQALLNAIKVYKFDVASTPQWQTSSDYWCNANPATTPPNSQCVLASGTVNNYFTNPQVYPNVDFSNYPAQNTCKDLGGRLPSLTELACIHANKASYIGAFGDTIGNSIYWSSTESSGWSQAMIVYFFNGNQNTLNKTSIAVHTRCVQGQ